MSEELAQGPYIAARVGFEPVTGVMPRMQGTELTTEPPSPTIIVVLFALLVVTSVISSTAFHQ